MRKSPLVLARITVIVAVSGILLSGCDAPPVGEVAPPRTPAVASPTPVAEAPTFPGPLVPTSCEQLAPLDLVQSALAAPVVLNPPVRPREFDNYFPLPHGPLEQAGGFTCVWHLADEVEGDLGIRIELLPRASAEWAIALPRLTEIDDNMEEFGVLSNSFGDSSSTNCASFEVGEGFYGNCFYNILAGEYWVYVHIEGRGRYGPDEPTRLHELEILNRIPSVLENLPSTEPTWSVPQTAFAPRNCAGLVGLDVMRVAAGSPSLIDNFSGPAAPYESFQKAASNLAGVLRCSWVSGAPDNYRTADIAVLPGGVWAWDGISTPLSEIPYDRGVPVPIDGIGDAAAGVCETPPNTRCELNVLIDDSWVVISTSTSGPDGIAALIPVANALAAAAAR